MRTPTAIARILRPTQISRPTRTVLIVWIALLAITVIWWWLTPENQGSATAMGKGLITAIVVLGMIKSRLIIRYFMEVRTAPRLLQLATDCWVIIVWLALLGINLYR